VVVLTTMCVLVVAVVQESFILGLRFETRYGTFRKNI
jgi:hypothetical protein